jgi:bpmI endonuclease-methyltransferase fusion protein type IIG
MKQSTAQNKDETFAMTQLTELTTLFERNKKQYTSVYDEANTRTDFIDKFFELLGWDIRNEQGYSEQYREVVREDKVTIGGKVKAPDYAFRIGGLRKFFVEAKKPSVNIKDELEPAFQVRRYGYTAKLPLCILTDFEEFAVYDTRIKPSSSDKPSAARIFYCTFDEYHKHFDFIFNTFSKEAILKGSFDTYIEENKNKKGTSEVDKELLKLIEGWRTDIAKNIALRNPSLDIYHLNTAVQKIIDRIIFLRIAEDKEMEEYGLLQKITESGTVYQKLQSVFDKANAKYNSGLFTPHDWLRSLTIDDAVLSSIINGLYYPECPYEFSILPVEILGNIYEQFLGKIITFRNIGGRVSSDRTNTRHTAIIEEKPEVKKAGGVYYTPQYIVYYIVENTLGVKIKGQSPDAVAKLKVVDPACGSGSFLIEAYQQLLNYHLDYYSSEKVRKQALKNSRIYETGKNVYKLTIEEKQRILLNNIYGVDIDGQAVEVTKLSLYLKLLENEGRETQGQLFKFSDIKLLPSLDSNIKCGNSLVSSDYYHEKDLSLFDDEAMRKINTFDWDKEFPEVFAQGGFDCVIGNPPYVNISVFPELHAYLQTTYSVIHTGYNDLMYYFMYRGIEFLKEDGLYGIITSNYFLGNEYAKKLRVFLSDKITKIVNFRNAKIFSANVHTALIFAEKHTTNDIDIFTYSSDKAPDSVIIENDYSYITMKRNTLGEVWVLADSKEQHIIDKMKEGSILLGDIAIIEKGPGTGKNDVFILKKEIAEKLNLEKELLRNNVKNGDIQRYVFNDRGTVLIYTDNKTDIKKYPNIYKYLSAHKKELSLRNEVLKGAYQWYRLERPRNKTVFDAKEKIIVPYRASFNRFAYDNQQYFNNSDSNAFIVKEEEPFLLKYILVLLNSKLHNWFYGFIGKPKGNSREYFNKPLAEIPIKAISLEDQAPLIKLADQMLETQARLQQALSDDDKKLLKQRAAILDKQIDNAVYKLYNLTADEVKIVEGK